MYKKIIKTFFPLEGHQYMQIGLSRYRCISCGYITNNTGQDPIISGIGGDSE